MPPTCLQTMRAPHLTSGLIISHNHLNAARSTTACLVLVMMICTKIFPTVVEKRLDFTSLSFTFMTNTFTSPTRHAN